ncbi:hypothetical protein CRG98_015738 [Punica granatum]|uniref:Sulfotransferase n=1 Tax=Punica granatum TaxID=22663 RepID=A0A2I0K5M7_PUNGR|nr:hypothetical protein CRG98_015738 [Punica granatum]
MFIWLDNVTSPILPGIKFPPFGCREDSPPIPDETTGTASSRLEGSEWAPGIADTLSPAESEGIYEHEIPIPGTANASPDKFNFGHCEKIVKRWASSAVNQEAKADAHTLRDLLFFLHVPRTGGRTYFHCFLKKLYSNSQECPRSYDKLRFDPSKAKCRLLVNHDDYSMMSKLPDERTSVVTILRNPVDRVFSTYEFSVERDARRRNGPIEVEGNDPYDMEEMVMPLHDYINDPIARDIIHNGATFQVAGLTNNSYFTDAHEVRHCIMQYKELGDYALAVAKKRLDNMLYVGLTEEHRESATMFANVVGAQVISQLKSTKPGAATAAAEETSEQSTILDPEPDDGQSQSLSLYPLEYYIRAGEWDIYTRKCGNW